MQKDYYYNIEAYTKQCLKNEFVTEFNEENSGKICYYIRYHEYGYIPEHVLYYHETNSILRIEIRDNRKVIIKYPAKIGYNTFITRKEAIEEIERRKREIKRCNECQYNKYCSYSFNCKTCEFFKGNFCSKIKELTKFEVFFDSMFISCKHYKPSKRDNILYWKGIDFHLDAIRSCDFPSNVNSKCLLTNMNDKHALCRSSMKGFNYWFNKMEHQQVKVKNDIFYYCKKRKDIFDFNFKEKEYISMIKVCIGFSSGLSCKYNNYSVEKYMSYEEVLNFIEEKKKELDKKNKLKVFEVEYRYKSENTKKIYSNIETSYIQSENCELAIEKFYKKKHNTVITEIKEFPIRWCDITNKRKMII